jgi:EAL domain-containing protein (putative c-di-GMP-specific phosphodiesterase class I)
VQGYAIARPMPAMELLAWLQRQQAPARNTGTLSVTPA